MNDAPTMKTNLYGLDSAITIDKQNKNDINKISNHSYNLNDDDYDLSDNDDNDDENEIVFCAKSSSTNDLEYDMYNNNNYNKSESSIVSIQSSMSTSSSWHPNEQNNGQLPLGILSSSVSTNNNNQSYDDNNTDINNDQHDHEEYNNNTIIKNNKKAKILQTVSSSRNKLIKIILYICLFCIAIGFLFGYITFILFHNNMTNNKWNNNDRNSNSNNNNSNNNQVIINSNNTTSTIPLPVVVSTITTLDNPIQDQYDYTLLSTIYDQSIDQIKNLLEQQAQHQSITSSVPNGIYVKFIVQGGQSFTIEISNDIIQIIPTIVVQFIQRIQNQQYSNTGISLVSTSFTGTATMSSNSESIVTTLPTTMNRQRLVCGQKTVEQSTASTIKSAEKDFSQAATSTDSTMMTTMIHDKMSLLASIDKYKLDVLTKSCMDTYSVRLDNLHNSEFHILLSSASSNEQQQQQQLEQPKNNIDYCFGRIVQGKDTIHKMKTGLLLTDNTQINILQTEIV